MGVYGLLLLLVVGLIVAVSGESGNYFFVVAPNMMRFGHPETVMVSVFGRERRVNIWLSHNNDVFARHNLNVSQVTPTTVTMQVRETDLKLEELESKPRTIKLIAECDGIRREKEILLQYSSGYIFVQTSQPVYVPRDIVKIRYLALTESMQKVGNTVNVSMDIISPKNQVFSRTHKTVTEPFYRYDFEMPANPDLGIWTIKVYYRGMYQTEARAFFEVREYVLPTFGVDVEVSNHTILPDSKGAIVATVTAKYVYGKPVEGWVDIKVYLKEDGDQNELFALPQRSFNAEGRALFEIGIERLRGELTAKGKWFPDGGTRLKILATAVEGATLKKELGMNERVLFSEVPYIFRFTRSKKYFRLLRKYYLKLDVTFPNGQAAIGKDVKARKLVNGILSEEQTGTTDKDGQITFIFGTHGERMTFKADDKDGKSTSEPFVVESYQGSNQISAEHIIKDGEDQIRAPNNMQNGTATGLTSVIIARGKILYAKYEQPDNDVVTVLTPELQEQISPTGRYVIFYCDTRTNEVVADSIRISVPPKCKGQKMLTLDTEQHILPGDSKIFRVTGQPGTDIGLSVVDKAVLLLNSKNVLHKNKLFEEMDSHDIGCGNGGGRTSAEVFNNAGLTVITDANMNSNSRETTSCGERARRKRSTVCNDVDQRCCEEAEKFASSLYENKSPADRVEDIECYIQVRKLALKHKLSLKCLLAYFSVCVEYVRFENSEDEIGTKSGDKEYKMDLEAISRNEQDVYVRKTFMESFLFSEFTLGANSGEMAVSVKYPDSITEWMIQAIGLTPSNGVCISEPLNVTAFRDFFIQLDLPYQAVRMEHLEVKATVFVYGTPGGSNSSVNIISDKVSIYMDGVDGLCSNVKPGRKSDRIEFEMTPNSAHTVRYPIIPMYAPKKYPIKVTAIKKQVGNGQTDAIEKMLSVVEGLRERAKLLCKVTNMVKENTVTSSKRTNEGEENLIELFSCLDPMKQLQQCLHSERISIQYSGGEVQTQIITVELTLPYHIKGTGQGVAYIYSDNAMEGIVQAVLIQGVESWIRLPTGCVEQTIIRLAPLVYAMKYLKLTNQVSEKIEDDGNNHIRQGVLREYGFKKTDHSYPPYARTGSSTWLTAFISKVFCQAKKVVDDSVEETVHVTPTINWLTTHQNTDGSFTEYNYVNHGPLMGLSQSGRPALTAFILIAMQECRTRSTNVETAVQKAMGFLERQSLDTLRQDPYALAITTYALALSNSTRKMTTYEQLKAIAGRREGLMYWGWPGNGQVQPSHIEATSYALLAQLQLDDLRSSNETVRWLSQHRSSGGAFKTTQDTVIGLQALSEYNIRTYRTDIDLTVKVMAEKYDEKIFRLNKDTAFVQNAASNLPVEDGGELRVEVTGKGTGNLRLDLRYNVEIADKENCPFEIDVKPVEIRLDETAIKINRDRGCACGMCEEVDEAEEAEELNLAFGELESIEIESNFGRRKRSSKRSKLHCTTVKVNSLIETVGMVTVEIGLETGMTVLQEDLDKLKEDELISMYEMPTSGKGFFVLYIDRMLKDETYAFSFTLKDTVEDGVFSRQAASVKVIDYYNPGSRCQQFYGTGSNKDAAFLAECNDVACQCLSNTCPVSWKDRLKIKFEQRKRNPNIQGPAEFLIERTCDSYYAEYAVLVRIVNDGDGNVDEKEMSVLAEVVTIYNRGIEKLVEGSNMTLVWRMDCEWPDFKKGQRYYVIAKDGQPYKIGKETKYKYHITEEDIVLEWKPPRTPVGRFMAVYEGFWKRSQCPK